MTLFEVVVATALLAAISIGWMQATTALHQSRRVTEQLDFAQREIDNLLEQHLHQPWDDLTSDAANSWKLTSEITSRLPKAELQATIDELTQPVRAKRITLKLRWQANSGKLTRPVVLTGWAYPSPEETSETSPQEKEPQEEKS